MRTIVNLLLYRNLKQSANRLLWIEPARAHCSITAVSGGSDRAEMRDYRLWNTCSDHYQVPIAGKAASR